MWLYTTSRDDLMKINRALLGRKVDSRFRFDLEDKVCRYTSRKPGLQISNVRLLHKKDYCGAHPGECQLNPFFQKPHMKASYLEGLDWVGFNKMLNDTIDALGLEAWIYSFNREARVHRYFIRRGRLRLWNYEMEMVFNGFNTFYHWATPKLEDYGDHVGKPSPNDEYPDGPGHPVWKLVEDHSEVHA